jgi:predicted dehydrogenase
MRYGAPSRSGAILQEFTMPERSRSTRSHSAAGSRRTSTRTLPSRGSTRRSRDGVGQVRYAVVGLGYIAQAAVLPAFAHARKNSRLAAFVSSDETKLKKLGRRYNIDALYSYDRYDDLLRSGEIDAVYIALPNHMHAEYTVRAAQAGIHVLCEKPMAITEDQCLRMIASCQDNYVKLMIAYRLHFDEANLKAIELVQAGKLGRDADGSGTARFFDSSFSINVKDEDNIRLQQEKGGGTLYDIGIYCINAARYLFQAEPTEVVCFSARPPGDPRFEDVEEMTSAIMRFPNDRLACFVCSFGAADTSTFRIVGATGELCVDNAYEYAEPITHYLTVNGKTKTKTFRKRDQFAPELIYFSDCILSDRDPEPSGEEGLIDVRIIEALYRSAKMGQAVKLNVFPPSKRPSIEQEIKSPPVREPELVHVGRPSED